MQVVDVLGGHMHVAYRRPPGQRLMPRIRFGIVGHAGAPQIPGPHGVRVFHPSGNGGHGLRINVFPQTSGVIAVGFQATFGAHSRAGEHLNVVGVTGKVEGLVEGVVEVCVGSHGVEGSWGCRITVIVYTQL